MPEPTDEVTEIDGNDVPYRLTLYKHNKRWVASVNYQGKELNVSQELLVSDPGSEEAMKALAVEIVHRLHQEIHPTE